MKKFLAILLLTVSGTVLAGPHGYYSGYRHHGHAMYHGGSNSGWIAPLIIGGVVGAAIANRPIAQTETVIVRPQPLIVQQQQNCTVWTETQNPDGTITRTRTCTQ